jgi:hypothetical protein
MTCYAVELTRRQWWSGEWMEWVVAKEWEQRWILVMASCVGALFLGASAGVVDVQDLGTRVRVQRVTVTTGRAMASGALRCAVPRWLRPVM